MNSLRTGEVRIASAVWKDAGMANRRRSYNERMRFWRRVEYVALGVMVVATAVLIYLLFV
jgi:hypothetical protein